MQNLIIILLWSFLCGVAYRLGGVGKPFDTKFRDIGCAFISLITIWSFGISVELGWTVLYLLCVFGTMTTCWEYWKTDDIEWFEWCLTGFFYGLSALPICLSTGRYLGLIIRTIILTIFMPFSNKLQFKAIWDKTDGVEFSRGFMFNITIPLLLL